jgi:nucleotidyltransferase/DNA polymerase involved in DNA repair
MTRVIFHLDMDAFYTSVEQRDNPALRGKPVIVGGPPTRRGVVCAASYEARKFGVRSAMPSATAGRLCPDGIFIPPRMERYKAESSEIMKILAASGARIEPMSIDEAYLDVSQVVSSGLTTNESDRKAAFARLVPDNEADAALYSAVPLARQLKSAQQAPGQVGQRFPKARWSNARSRAGQSSVSAVDAGAGHSWGGKGNRTGSQPRRH